MNTYSLDRLQEKGYEVSVRPEVYNRIKVEDFLMELSDRERTILEKTNEGYNLKEITKMYECMSYNTVRRLNYKARKKMIKYFNIKI